MIKSEKKCRGPQPASRRWFLLDLYIHFWQQPPLIGNKLARWKCLGNIWESQIGTKHFLWLLLRLMVVILQFKKPMFWLIKVITPGPSLLTPPIKIWKLLVIAFGKCMTSRGPRMLCGGPETPTQWKCESVTYLPTDQRTHRGRY